MNYNTKDNMYISDTVKIKEDLTLSITKTTLLDTKF